MVSELDIERCVSEEAKLQRRWTRGSVPTRMAIPEGGGLGGPKRMSASEDARPRRGVDYKFPHQLGRRTKHYL